MQRKLLPLIVCFSFLVSACAVAEPAGTEIGLADSPEVVIKEAVGGVEDVFSEFSSTEDLESGSQESTNQENSVTYSVVDTDQGKCYDDTNQIACPEEDETYYGQDAQYKGEQPVYVNNGDGTVSDRITGLMWAGSPDLNGDGLIDVNDKLSYREALDGAEGFDLGGYSDWRLPSMKELYSLINFNGLDPSGLDGVDSASLVPFLDGIFEFGYGDTNAGERLIDAQFATTTSYTSTTMDGNETMFGVNFADGRIKGYPVGEAAGGMGEKLFYVLYVRGNPEYGENEFLDNQDGTISDMATGLTWTEFDSGEALDWGSALAYCEDLEAGGYSDWRLPNVKELQSIVDYSLSPDATGTASVNPLFSSSVISNEAGETDYPAYWSSTTHANNRNGAYAAYISFGRAMGYMHGSWMDVHGAGAQRSDPKSGDPLEYPHGHGPQGDAIRIINYARCVRGGVEQVEGANPGEVELDEAASLENNQPGLSQRLPAGGVPPEESLQACSGLSEGSACQFSAPHGMVSGVCLPISSQLACIPGDGPGRKGGSPP